MKKLAMLGRISLQRKSILAVVFVTYSLAYLDRANYGFGAAAGLAQTLHITGRRSALLAALFFLGYFAFQVPGMLAARRFSAARLVFFALIAWGILASLTGVIRNFPLLALDRFLLGVAESVIFPAMLLLLTHWFKRGERSRANTFLMLGNPVTVLWMSALTGYLIQHLGWQRTFILEGLPAIVWAIVWFAVIADEPSQANWMQPEAAAQLEAAIAEEHNALVRPGAPVRLRSVLLRPDVLLLSLQYFCWSLGVYGFVLWLPTIVRHGTALPNGTEISMSTTGLLSAVPYVAAVGLMLLVARNSDRTLRRQELVWPFLLIAGFAMLGSFLLASHSFSLAFLCLVVAGGCMYAPYGPFFAIIPERVPRQATGEALAMVNSCGALGGFAGTYLVGMLQAITGNSRAGFLAMSLALMVSALLLLLLPKAAVVAPYVEAKLG